MYSEVVDAATAVHCVRQTAELVVSVRQKLIETPTE